MENLSAKKPQNKGNIIVEKVFREAIAPISNPENPILWQYRLKYGRKTPNMEK